MKNALKMLGIIAIVAVIGFSMVACGNPDNGPIGPISGSLPAPTGLTATALTAETIVLSWNTVSGGVLYRVYASFSASSGYQLLETTTSNSTIFTGASPGTTYYFKVTVYSAAGIESAMSSYATVTTQGGGSGIVSVTGVTLSQSTLSLAVGQSSFLTAIVAPSNATNKNVVWASDTPSVAYVAEGTVTAISAGTAKITVTTIDGFKTAICTVTVTANTGPVVAVTGVNVNPTTLNLNVGATGTLNATIQPNNATNQAVTWNSSNTSVAIVNNGVVTALSIGTAQITVTADGNHRAYCQVTVTAAAGANNTFTSISDMTAWLRNQPDNTATNPYTVYLNVSSLGTYMNGSVASKYVNLDLSGSTFASFPSNAFWTGDGGYITSITMGNSVTSIGASAFEGNKTLTRVTIGSKVTSIAAEAFYGSGLTSVTIPDSVTSIGNEAFRACAGLTSLTIGSGLTTIGQSTFQNCTSLTSVTIGSGVKTIGQNAFYGCNNLASITIPSNVTSIQVSAFENCTNLRIVTIGSGVTDIGNNAFKSTGLTSINIPNNVTNIGNEAFRNCLNLESVTIERAVIGTSAFYGCTTLTTVTIGNSVPKIGNSAFSGCTTLNSVTIGSSVNEIGSSAFYSCNNLASITIPSSVTTFGSSAFSNCAILNSVTFAGTNNTITISGAFASGTNLQNAYRAATGGAGTYTKSGTTWTKSS